MQTPIIFEQNRLQAIGPQASPSDTIAKYKERLRSDGWDLVRQALAVSVRSNIIIGVVSELVGQPGQACARFRHVISLIKIARAEMDPRNEHLTERGAVLRERYLLRFRCCS